MRPFLILLFLCGILQAQTWLQIQDFPGLERDDGVSVNVNGKLYFGSGLTVGWGYAKDFYALDPSTNNWSAIAPMPDGAQRQYASAFAATGAFFVFGGDGPNGPLNDLYKYTIAGNSWAAMASKPGNGLFGSCCLELGDRKIIIGGKRQGNSPPVSEVWEYRISTNSWTQKNNFPGGGLFRASAAVINNTGYLLFGLDTLNRFRKEMYRYNEASDSWTRIVDFPQALGRAYASLTPVEDQLVLFGGYDSLNTYHKDLWYFDPLSNGWSQKADFVSSGRKGGMAAVASNKLYYSCGINVTDTRLKETWLYDFPVGLSKHQQKGGLNFYPNPVNDILNIETGDKTINEFNCAVFNACGDLVLIASTIDKKLDVAQLKPGIYFVRVSGGDIISSRSLKLVKE